MVEPALEDLSDVPFDELLAVDSVNLAACLKRLLSDLDDPNGVISAFESFASSDS